MFPFFFLLLVVMLPVALCADGDNRAISAQDLPAMIAIVRAIS
jgi:hypothetical protein